MRFTHTEINPPQKTIVANDMHAEIAHVFATDAKAGDVVDGMGVCFYDVTAADNPNGAVMYFGTVDMRHIDTSQYPTAAQVSALPLVKWLNEDNTFFTGTTV